MANDCFGMCKADQRSMFLPLSCLFCFLCGLEVLICSWAQLFLATKKFELIIGTFVLLCFLDGQAHWFTYNERMPIESNVNVWAWTTFAAEKTLENSNVQGFEPSGISNAQGKHPLKFPEWGHCRPGFGLQRFRQEEENDVPPIWCTCLSSGVAGVILCLRREPKNLVNFELTKSGRSSGWRCGPMGRSCAVQHGVQLSLHSLADCIWLNSNGRQHGSHIEILWINILELTGSLWDFHQVCGWAELQCELFFWWCGGYFTSWIHWCTGKHH